MFFNPFPTWYIILVVIPAYIFYFVTYLPYYPLKFIGLGKWYQKGHYFVLEHIQQFILQPKNYCKNIKKINIQIIKDCNKYKEN